MKNGGWLDQYQEGGVAKTDATRVAAPALKLTKAQLEKNKAINKQVMAKTEKANAKKLAERKKAVAESSEADIINPNGKRFAIGDKFRLFPNDVSGVGEIFDDYINPLTFIGNTASGLGNAMIDRDVKALATEAGLALGAGALGFDPLGSLPKAPKNLNVVRSSMDPSALFKKNTNKFASEINWGKWNKEIPDNVPLMQEYNAIEKTAKANGSWMKNNDGSAFQGTPEQFVQQNSQNFKKAFGNTKFKDEKGNPMILHHGHFTDRDFSSFMPSEMSGISNSGYEGNYSFFTPHKSLAEDYAGIGQGLEDVQGYNSYVKSVYLNSEKPLIDPRTEFADRDIPKSLREGRDAITRSLDPKEFSEVAVPYGNNVKSATGNNGMFDLTKRNIYKSVAPIIGAGAAASQFVDQKKNGGWLDKYNDGGPIQPNYNDSNASAGPGFEGDGYSNVGRNYSPAWGGQFAMGGSIGGATQGIPGATGFMYARTGTTPSNGKYAKKTKASAQNGTEMKFYQEGLDFKPKSISRDGDNIAYSDNTRVGNIPRYTRPSNYQGNQPDTLGENIFEIIDPSGISSWDDIYRSYNQTGMSGQTAMEAFGAIPMLGKAKQFGRAVDALSTGLALTKRQKRNAKVAAELLKATGKYGPNAGRATDAIQAYTQRNEYEQGGQLTKLDQLSNFTNYNTKQPGSWLDKYQ
jgi:hypothetical protein